MRLWSVKTGHIENSSTWTNAKLGFPNKNLISLSSPFSNFSVFIGTAFIMNFSVFFLSYDCRQWFDLIRRSILYWVNVIESLKSGNQWNGARPLCAIGTDAKFSSCSDLWSCPFTWIHSIDPGSDRTRVKAEASRSVMHQRLSELIGAFFCWRHLQISKVRVEHCASYTNCSSCLEARDPYCGWCSLEKRWVFTFAMSIISEYATSIESQLPSLPYRDIFLPRYYSLFILVSFLCATPKFLTTRQLI